MNSVRNPLKVPTRTVLYGVLQGFVLGPLLFIFYTTPLSTLIAQSSAQHQLFADDTQLFLSFSAPDFSVNGTRSP